MLATDNESNIKTNLIEKQRRHYRSGLTLFFSIYPKNKINLSFGIICLFITALGQTLPAVFTSQALGELGTNGFSFAFLIYCLAIVLSSIVFLITSFLGGFTFFKAASAYERDIRQESFEIIQDHSLTFHDDSNSNQLLSKLTNEITQMRQGIFPSQRMILTSFFSFLLTLVFLSTIGPNYVIVTIIGFILFIYFAYRASLKIGPVREQRAIELGDLTESSQEIFRGIEVVRGNYASEREKERYSRQSQLYASIMERESKLQAFYIPTLIVSLLTAVIFSMALIDFSSGVANFSFTLLIEAVALLFSLQMNTRTIPNAFLMTQAGLVNANRIWDIMNWEDPYPDQSTNGNGLDDLINWNGDITFKNVSFSYGNGLTESSTNVKSAIKNLNVTIPGGSKVAVIGGPGAGKSTLLKLLLRLYDPQLGAILIDSYDYIEIPPKLIRKHVSRVEQELFLFSGTILNNIAYSRPTASIEEVIAVAKAAQADEFIEEMPKKYDTIIGERGVTLSGGQKQRIGIARALLANPHILLLDDSVSAIDSRTEYFLRKALDTLMENRTSFTVTQRLVTLVNADFIMLFDKGNLIGFGTHTELLKTIPEYKRIFDLLPKSERVISFDDGEVN